MLAHLSSSTLTEQIKQERTSENKTCAHLIKRIGLSHTADCFPETHFKTVNPTFAFFSSHRWQIVIYNIRCNR